MKKFVLAAVAAVAFASPAMANEARVEVRGGLIAIEDTSETIYGAAAGYDIDMGPVAFVGVEVSADKIDLTGTKTAFGFTGRIGGRSDSGLRAYATGGYTTEACDGCEGQWHAGVGVQQSFAGMFYGKVEYRRYFETDNAFAGNAGVVGLGVRF